MITEDYVSFETAKLLKEKGFDGPCYKVWESHGDSQTLVGAPYFVEGETVVNRESVDAAAKQYAYEYSLNNNIEGYLAPTIQMVMKWLREKHNIVIAIDYDYEFTSDSYCFKTYRLGENGKPERCAIKGEHYDKETNKMIEDIVGYRDYERSCDEYITYEQACEAAIKYCLEKLI